jgi:hypothetical protein
VADVQDVDLFIHMAEIAGVFVGFGALIAIRSGPLRELSDIRWVMTSGIWVVIAALAPIIVSRYGMSGHQLWLANSLVALAIFAVMLVVNSTTPEIKADRAEAFAATPLVVLLLWAVPTIWLPIASLVVALVIVALGLLPAQEEAIYVTAVGMGLFMGAMGLFSTVFWPGGTGQAGSGKSSA